jgi:DNA-binding NarL/FixJ family response regulator
MKVLLVDDHPLILAALQSVIRGLGDDVTVQGVDSERGARQLLAEDPDQDLLLLDLQLGATDGFELLADLRSQYPALPIVVVSASDRASDVIRAIDAGAMGFVPKRASNDILFEALRMVMSGGIYVPPMTLGMTPAPPAPPKGGDTVPDVMRPHADSGSPPEQMMGDAGHDAPRSFAELGLSKRQADVLAYLLKGMPNKLIAREMHISIETVKDHVAAVLKALGVSSRTQAVLLISQMAQQGSLAGWRASQR